MLVFTTLVHMCIFLWERIVHVHSGVKLVGGGGQISKRLRL